MTCTDDYAERLIPHALRLAGTVHERDPAAIHALLRVVRAMPAPPGTEPLEALAVTLAGMVDPDRCPSELLSWLDDARPVDPPPGPDPLEVQHVAEGHIRAHRVNRATVRAAVALLHSRGLDDQRIADRLGKSSAAIFKLRQRMGLPSCHSDFAQHRGVA